MPRLMSFAKTWPAITEGVEVYSRVFNEIAGRELAVREMEPALDGLGISWEWSGDLVRVFKDVTRRSSRVVVDETAFGRKIREWRPGWEVLKPVDRLEGTEWAAGRGPLWVCSCCGKVGPPPVEKDVAVPPVRVPGDLRGLPQEALDGMARRGDIRCPLWHLAPSDCAGWRNRRCRYPRRRLLEVVSVREERLGDITAVEVAREGFPGKSPEWFVDFYCDGRPDPDRPVNRIELREVS